MLFVSIHLQARRGLGGFWGADSFFGAKIRSLACDMEQMKKRLALRGEAPAGFARIEREPRKHSVYRAAHAAGRPKDRENTVFAVRARRDAAKAPARARNKAFDLWAIRFEVGFGVMEGQIAS